MVRLFFGTFVDTLKYASGSRFNTEIFREKIAKNKHFLQLIIFFVNILCYAWKGM